MCKILVYQKQKRSRRDFFFLTRIFILKNKLNKWGGKTINIKISLLKILADSRLEIDLKNLLSHTSKIMFDWIIMFDPNSSRVHKFSLLALVLDSVNIHTLNIMKILNQKYTWIRLRPETSWTWMKLISKYFGIYFPPFLTTMQNSAVILFVPLWPAPNWLFIPNGKPTPAFNSAAVGTLPNAEAETKTKINIKRSLVV